MKTLFACLLAGGILFLASSLSTRADQFTQIQNSPNTYWVSPSETGSGSAPSQYTQAPSSPPPSAGYQYSPSTPPPSGYGYYAPSPYGPPPGYVAAPPPYYYYPPPRPAYYPYASYSYYNGHSHGFVGIPLPGIFLGFRIH